MSGQSPKLESSPGGPLTSSTFCLDGEEVPQNSLDTNPYDEREVCPWSEVSYHTHFSDVYSHHPICFKAMGIKNWLMKAAHHFSPPPRLLFRPGTHKQD